MIVFSYAKTKLSSAYDQLSVPESIKCVQSGAAYHSLGFEDGNSGGVPAGGPLL